MYSTKKEGLSDESTIKNNRNEDDKPLGEESSEEEGPESEAETTHSTVTTASTDTNTTETSSSSKQAANFSKKWLKGRALVGLYQGTGNVW